MKIKFKDVRSVKNKNPQELVFLDPTARGIAWVHELFLLARC